MTAYIAIQDAQYSRTYIHIQGYTENSGDIHLEREGRKLCKKARPFPPATPAKNAVKIQARLFCMYLYFQFLIRDTQGG